MDQHDRDKFYSDPVQPSDDDEYELEAPDPVVEENRRKSVRASIDPTIDIDEIYREADRDRGTEIIENWVSNFRYQYRHEHILIGTALLAIVVALAKLQILWTAILLLFVGVIFGLYSYLQWQERKQQEEADRKREIVYAKRRAKLASRASGHAVGTPEIPGEEEEEDIEQPAETSEPTAAAVAKPPFQFQFSVAELATTLTVAAVLLGFTQLAGGANFTATIFGAIALIGLVVFATRYSPPQVVLLGWWMILLLYVFTTLLAAAWRSG